MSWWLGNPTGNCTGNLEITPEIPLELPIPSVGECFVSIASARVTILYEETVPVSVCQALEPVNSSTEQPMAKVTYQVTCTGYDEGYT